MAVPSSLTHIRIREVLTSCGLECDSTLAARVETYLTFLSKWNTRMNLTAIQSPLDVLKILLAESFFGAGLVGDPRGPILDVGSGAGFPGLAMAVYRPELELILLEPRKKRAAFLMALRRELALPRVAVWSRRLEEVATGDFSEPPTVLTMRGVAAVGNLITRGMRFLRGSRGVLLFSSVETAYATMESITMIAWQPPSPIPWNPNHLVLVGHAQGNVSGETMHGRPTPLV